MTFKTRLHIVESERPHWWILAKDLVYDGKWDRFDIPGGFHTDLASVPKMLWSIIPPAGLHAKASVVHDYLYRFQGISRKDADGIFRRIMRENGVSWIRRWTMYGAVRSFGWLPWKKNEKAGYSL